jgi:hypothetical protein
MGADSLDVDKPYARNPETLAAAARYLVSSGNADLLEVLGLVDEPVKPPTFVVRNGRSYCPDCNKRVSASGYCFACNPRKRGEDQ